MSELFIDFPIVTSRDELLLLQEENSELHPGYVALCSNGVSSVTAFRKKIESVWDWYEEHADANFLTEFRGKDFHLQRLWELYLANLFHIQSFYFLLKGEAGPDFKLGCESETIWVEAIAPKETSHTKIPWLPVLEDEEGNPLKFEMHEFSGTVNEIDHPRTLRLTAAAAEKLRKFEGYVSGSIVGSEPRVVAISGSCYDASHSDGRDALAAFFGVGDIVVHFDRSSGDTSVSHRPRLMVENHNGSPVDTALFFKEEYRSISAIVYSTTSILSEPEDGSNLMVLINPQAEVPIDPRLFSFARVYVFNAAESAINRIYP